MKENLRTFLTFEADFPDDSEVISNGDIVRPAGRNIAQALCELLGKHELKTSAPEQHSFYGWKFTISNGKIPLSVLLQCPSPWLLISEQKQSLISKIFRGNSSLDHRNILQTLHHSLLQDHRFSNIRWFTKAEYEEGLNRVGGVQGP